MRHFGRQPDPIHGPLRAAMVALGALTQVGCTVLATAVMVVHREIRAVLTRRMHPTQGPVAFLATESAGVAGLQPGRLRSSYRPERALSAPTGYVLASGPAPCPITTKGTANRAADPVGHRPN